MTSDAISLFCLIHQNQINVPKRLFTGDMVYVGKLILFLYPLSEFLL